MFQQKKSHPRHDLTGEVFGRLRVLRFDGIRRAPNGHSKRFWLCECSCPCKTQCLVRTDQLTRGVTQSCGCLQRETASELFTKPEVQERKRKREAFRAQRLAEGLPIIHNFKDLTGEHFGRLRVIKLDRVEKNQSFWVCRCTCPAENYKTVTASKLGDGHVKSCGCLEQEHRENGEMGKANVTHGHAQNNRPTPTYTSWTTLKRRCLQPTWHNYPEYGGRGIQVCDRWRDSFENFLADMGERPPGTTINRKNNDGNYEPGNCEWASAKEQADNRRPKRKRN